MLRNTPWLKLLIASMLVLAACTGDTATDADAGPTASADAAEGQAAASDEDEEDDGATAGNGGADPGETGDGAADEATGSPTLDDPYVDSYGNGGYDVAHYDLTLDWDPEREHLDGRAVITATATQDLDRFNLDLVGLTVEAVTVDGTPGTFRHEGSELTIIPADRLADGAAFSVEVVYGGKPGEGIGSGPGIEPSGWQTEDGYIYVAGEPIAAATFHPANDHPSDKASFTYRITAPSDLTVAASGTKTSVDIDGDSTTWVFDQPFPQTTYLTTILIGSFDVVDAGASSSGVPIRNVYDSALTDAAAPQFAEQAAMIDHFEELFGPYPFDVYGSAVVRDSLGGALETQTLSIFGQDVVGFGNTAELIVAHELAHQWFGNAVSIERWEDLWLNEGFASYAEALWRDQADPDFTYQGWIEEVALLGPELEERVQRHPIENLFAVQIYQRGALALHALRVEIGDEVFFDLLRTWVERYGGGNATTADFEALAEELSGQELTPLLDRWIREPELPDSLDGVDLSGATKTGFVTLDDIRSAVRQYAGCVTEAGATFGADPAEDDPQTVLDEVARLEVSAPETHEACNEPLREIGLGS